METSPRPAIPHAAASSSLGMALGTRFQLGWDGPGGWWIVDEPELHLGQDVLVPDLAGWRRSRLESLPSVPHMTLAADWICEVISPSTAGLDRVRKMPIYAREGVLWAWLIDPIARTLEVFRRHEEGWVVHSTHEGAATVHAAPFEAVGLELGVLWISPPGG